MSLKYCVCFKNDIKLSSKCYQIFKAEFKYSRFCPACEQELFKLGIKKKDYLKIIKNGG
jgi:hypothetical protein